MQFIMNVSCHCGKFGGAEGTLIIAIKMDARTLYSCVQCSHRHAVLPASI